MSDDDMENGGDEGSGMDAPPAPAAETGDFLEDTFGITKAGSTVEGEIRAGVTTFLTMAYILFVNPDILSVSGIPFNDALFATAVAAFVGCVIMGLWANLPFALAPGMGLNAYFAFTVTASWGMGIEWEIALAAVLVEGVIFMILSLPQIGWRTQMINSIPKDLKIATGAGIGMFLAIIGFSEMGWVVDHPATLVDMTNAGAFTHQSGELWGLICLIAIAVMMAKGIKGAMIYGILGTTIIGGWIIGASDPYNGVEAVAIGSMDNLDTGGLFEVAGLPEESMFAAIYALGDLTGDNMGDFILVMIAFLFVDIFDTAGTLYSVGRQAGYVDENDELKNSDEAFMSDAGATIVGALAGTSTTTTYIESAAGVEEGGKTGLVAVVVGVLMLSGLLLAGLFTQIPTFAAAPALVVVGAMMMKQAADINWNDKEISIPAFITMVLMPFTYSIADGIAWGLISYVAIKIGVGKMDQLNPVVNILAVVMLMFYVGPGDQTTFDWLLSFIF